MTKGQSPMAIGLKWNPRKCLYIEIFSGRKLKDSLIYGATNSIKSGNDLERSVAKELGVAGIFHGKKRR